MARRTQAQRRAITRAKLIDATVRCLVDLGYAGTTTARVCRQAGLSSGALFQHFPTKADLLAAAAEDVLDRVRTDAAILFVEMDPDLDPIERAVHLAWRIYRRADLKAVLELFVVGRTDPELAERLRAVNAPHRKALVELARLTLPPEIHQRQGFEDVLEFVLNAVGGITLGIGVDPEGSDEPAQIDALVEATRLLVANRAPTASAAATGIADPTH